MTSIDALYTVYEALYGPAASEDAALPSRVQCAAGLSRYTAARIGGAADWLIVADRDAADLVAILRAAWAATIPTRVLGGGSNVLIGDGGWRGLIVIDAVRTVLYEQDTVRVSAGHGLIALARLCAGRGLAGLEWAAGVPGTVGGAVVGNAGAHGGDMAGNLTPTGPAITLIDADHSTPYTLTHADLAYGYRASALKARTDKRFLVLEATLRLPPNNPADIAARLDEYSAYRKRTQPPGASLGSIFKNPPGDYAGRLIEVCGLKGYTVGAAQVSPVHANFFINVGGAACAADYAALIDQVQARVHAATGVLLHPEIERLGDF